MVERASDVALGRRAVTAGLLLALAVYALLVARFDFTCDDAYISFRYARNWADGHGPVYNPGSDPPVEGYSEFLWVALLSVFERIGWHPAIAAKVVTIPCGLALVALTVLGLARRSGIRLGAFLSASLLLGALPPLAVWTTGGMATMPFALAVYVLATRSRRSVDTRDVVAASVAAVIVVLLRADGALWVAAICGSCILVGALRSRTKLMRTGLVSAVIALVAFGLHVAWRRSVYADWLPNTARVKAEVSAQSLEQGGLYVAHVLATFPALAVILLVALVALKESLRSAPMALLVVLTTIAYATLIGGDFMCFGRFLVPALPFFAILMAVHLSNLERRLGTRMTAIGGLALGLTCLLPAWNRTLVPKSVLAELHFRWNAPVFLSEFEQWARMREQCDEWRTLGRALRHVSRPTDSFVYGAVGAVGYESMLMIYDRNGLVTREVALLERPQGRRSPGHAKTVPKEFFLPMRPTWLDAFLLPSGKAPPPHFDLSTWRVFDLPTELGVEPGTKLFAQPGDA